MGSTVSLRRLASNGRLLIVLSAVVIAAALAGGCSKSNNPDESAKTADGGSNGAPAAPVAGPSIFTSGQTAAAAPVADGAWAERCRKMGQIAQANELAAQAVALQDREDFAAAAEKLNQYVALQIQMNGEKSDMVKSARSRVAENQWLASLTPDSRKQLRQAAQIEAEAEAESTKGHFDVAKDKGLKAIQIYQQVGAQNTAAYGRLALFVADKYVLLGDFKTAAQAYQVGLSVTEQTEGIVSSVYANALLAMSGMWMNMGDFVEAVKTLDKACDVFAMLGEGETSAAYCLMMVGVIHKEVGNLDQSEKLLKQAIQQAEALAGAGKSILGEALQHLAGVYYRTGNYAAAEQTQLKAMQVLQEALGESPVLIGCRSRLARIYIKSGQIGQAETMLKNAAIAGREAFGENTPVPSYATQYLGELYVAKQNYAAAAPLLAQALAIREKGHGENHPAVAEILESYSAALRGLGRNDEADRLDARKRAIDSNLVAAREKLSTVATRIIAERPTRRQ
ncbi:MAG TPA: tetratricopeptide repeat protein [Pirellulales bacterium]|nr:tetratricopeptide repeat protein [Pirellulales bacterium]